MSTLQIWKYTYLSKNIFIILATFHLDHISVFLIKVAEFVCTETTQAPTGLHLKLAFPCKNLFTWTPALTPQLTHTHITAGTTHTLVFIWNIVGGTGPVQSAVNSSGATLPFDRPKFPFLRSAAWAGSAVLQAFSRPRRPQRPCWQHFTGNMAWQGWPDGPPRSAHCHTKHSMHWLTHGPNELSSLRGNKSRKQCTNSSNAFSHRHCGRQRVGGCVQKLFVCLVCICVCVCVCSRRFVCFTVWLEALETVVCVICMCLF